MQINCAKVMWIEEMFKVKSANHVDMVKFKGTMTNWPVQKQ